ncbi:MAG: hypothetical protein NZ521_08540 [Flammeovirgaceae bacterium]|nr:hypothetical protein [Flammeovirgaceae bacterium]MDW8286749.1 hypothetical protein [Flammeovirgaceae bacterium]
MTADQEKEKKQLLSEAKNYQTQLIKQVEETTEVVKTESQKVVFMVIGVLAAFSIIQLLVILLRSSDSQRSVLTTTSDTDQSHTPTTTHDPPALRLFKKLIMEFLLILAKKILQEALEKYKKKDESNTVGIVQN